MKHYLDAWRKMATFKERSTRKEFWMFFGINLGVMAAIIFLIVMFTAISAEIPAVFFSILYLMYVLVAVIPTVSISVRRLHDVGRSGWMYLLGFIPVAGPIIMLVFSLQVSQDGENKFGLNSNTIGNTSDSNFELQS